MRKLRHSNVPKVTKLVEVLAGAQVSTSALCCLSNAPVTPGGTPGFFKPQSHLSLYANEGARGKKTRCWLNAPSSVNGAASPSLARGTFLKGGCPLYFNVHCASVPACRVQNACLGLLRRSFLEKGKRLLFKFVFFIYFACEDSSYRELGRSVLP